MAMSKSISKKILLLMLVAVASIALAFSLFTRQTAVADQVSFENTYDGGARVTSDSEIESRRDEILAGIDFYKSAIPTDVLVVDPDDKALDIAISGILNHYGDFEPVSKSLFGNTGLNGILGIYEVAYNFYNDYIVTDADGFSAVAKEHGLKISVSNVLVANAKAYIAGCTAKAFENDPSQGASSDLYDKTRADAWVESFKADEVKGLAQAIALNTELSAHHELTLAQIDYYRSYFFSDKFGSAYVNEFVYGSTSNVSTARANEVKDQIDLIFATAINYEEAIAQMDAKVSEYIALFDNVKSALERAYDEVVEKSNLNSDSADTPDNVIALCESAFTAFSKLGTIDHYTKTGEEFNQIDLKTGVLVGLDGGAKSDVQIASKLLHEYKNAVKRSIEEKDNVYASEYGVSANASIGNYIDWAKGLADCLVGYGTLTEKDAQAPTVNGYSANQYYYVNNGKTIHVVDGSDIVKAFQDSFSVNGALAIYDNGEMKVSESLTEYKRISTITYTPTAPEGQTAEYTISLTCVDKDGNEVNYFDSTANLMVREGATPSIERNLYLILKGDKLDSATKNLSEAEKELVGGRVLLYYFTFTVSERLTSNGDYKVLEINDPIDVVITINFTDAEQFTEIKEKTLALSYCHTTINHVYNDIQWGDTTMTFKVSDFTNEVQLAMAKTADAPFDWVALAIFGFVGLVALFFLIWLIVIIVKNWKYKITFYANGGKYNSTIKVKLHEKFNHPAPPVRKGYHFLGWYRDAKCTVKFADSELVKRGNIKVYALWISDAEYEALNEKYKSSAAVVVGTVTPAEGTKKDATVAKFEAKKAEEERKTEEVKLQAIREIEEAKKNAEARAEAEKQAEDAKAETEKVVAERDALVQEARADERAKTIEEMKSVAPTATVVDYDAAIAQAKAETEEKLRKEFDEESKARADEQARINAEFAAKIKALEDDRERALEDARLKAEEDARKAIVEEPVVEVVEEPVVEVVEEPVVETVEEPTPAFDVEHVFDVLKAEIYSFTDADDLGYGLEASVPACAMKVVDATIELEVNLDLDDCAKKGYKVVAGEKLPVKFVLASDDDIDEAEELIGETMFVNGLVKTKKAVITAATAETRANGFEHGVSKDRVADTPEEFYKLLRVYAQSFVYADDDAVEDKALIKMFLARGRVFMYVNYSAEGLNACDEVMVAQGYKSMMTIKDADECKVAIKHIAAMMKENGLVRFPSEIKISGDESIKGFTYTLKK